jgi:bifunctional enzyme CysN/CysC
MEVPPEDRELIAADILQYLKQHEEKDLLRFLTAGSVDDGKSTLIGRLLFDTKAVYEDQLAAVERDSSRHGTVAGETDLALLTDGLKAEREQGITIDVAYRFFSTAKRKFIIADTPGHEQYTRNMATGASTADLAIILIDARQGVLAQTKRHSFIATLLGIKHILVAVNKMDLVDYKEERFEEICDDFTDFAARLDCGDLRFVPISALKGDNVVNRSERTSWYKGSTLLEILETVHIASDRNMIDLRFPVQMVMRPDHSFRGFCGTVSSGVMRVGDEVMALPSGERSKVDRIVTFDGDLDEAFAPQAVTVSLEDEIDISRGDMLVRLNNVPRHERLFETMIVWMSDVGLREGRSYIIKCGTQTLQAEAVKVRYRYDINTLSKDEPNDVEGLPGLCLNEVGRVLLESVRPILFDPYSRNRSTGSVVIIDRMTNVTIGAGMILNQRPNALVRSGLGRDRRNALSLLKSVGTSVSEEARQERFGHTPLTVWLTGLPRVGKTTIAYALESRLWERGCAVNVLDGVDMRMGLSRDLGFSADERSEASRRAAETARVFNLAGLITIAGFVSPYAADREDARGVVGEENFLEVWLKAPVEVCEARDKALHPDGQGLYAKARRGDIKNFTGLTAPYEEPDSPDLVIETNTTTVEASVDAILKALEARGVLSP